MNSSPSLSQRFSLYFVLKVLSLTYFKLISLLWQIFVFIFFMWINCSSTVYWILSPSDRQGRICHIPSFHVCLHLFLVSLCDLLVSLSLHQCCVVFFPIELPQLCDASQCLQSKSSLIFFLLAMFLDCLLFHKIWNQLIKFGEISICSLYLKCTEPIYQFGGEFRLLIHEYDISFYLGYLSISLNKSLCFLHEKKSYFFYKIYSSMPFCCCYHYKWNLFKISFVTNFEEAFFDFLAFLLLAVLSL